jgi:hypothetical protein
MVLDTTDILVIFINEEGDFCDPREDKKCRKSVIGILKRLT